MLETLTLIADKARKAMGDSECPLAKRCPNYDSETPPCTDTRGRNITGERAGCYKFSKQQIKEQKRKRQEEALLAYDEYNQLAGDDESKLLY